MSYFKLPALLAFLLLLTTGASAIEPTDVYYPGELWVQFQPNATIDIAHSDDQVDLEDFIQLIGTDLQREFELQKVRKPFHFAKSGEISEVYQFFFAQEGRELEFARALEKLNVVRYAERVPIMRPTLTPNDLGPEFGNNNQWSLWRVNAQEAWDITTAQDTPIVVAIVDDAVLVTHPDLIPNLVPGYDVADNDNDPMPNESAMTHGTHVAGISGAATNNGIGVASIGFNVKIMPIKASNSAQFISDAYAGVIWAADNNADVINMSWGGSGFSNTGQNIINYAYAAGCVNVAAAGNDNTSQIFYPAGYDNVISVASTTTNDSKSGFSNFGSWIDVSAPGSAIRSTYFNSSLQPTYANLQGTSMASPMVAGLAGLVWSVNPEMTQTQVMDCVMNTADNINNANGSFIGLLGSGRINALAAVQCALTTVNAPPVATINSTNNVSCPGGLIQFLGSSAGGLATTYNWNFPGGNPATSNQQNPVVSYSAVGFYDVSLTVSNDFGDSDITLPAYIEVSSNGVDIFFSEDFESGSFAEMGWTVENPDGDITWDLFTVAGSVSGNRAPGINIFNYNAPGQRDRLITPPLDFSNHTNIVLDFQHAHRRFSQDFSDSLLIDVSTNGGATWERLLSAAETGQGTFATGVILNQNFVPANGNDWCFGGDIGSGCFTIDLGDYSGESNVLIRFETFNDYGNNIYIDNVELSGNCLLTQAAPLAGFTANQTVVCVGQPVQFLDQSVNVPTSYMWSFPGGTPASASSPAPVIAYNQPGTYPVTLTVENAFGTDVTTIDGFITVNPSPLLSVNQTDATICVGTGVQLSASGAENYTWSPNIGLSSTVGANVTASPTGSQTYILTGFAGGCSVDLLVNVNVLQGPEAPEVVTEDEVAFVMTSPAERQGHYAFSPPAAGWGSPALNSVSIEAPIVVARDNSAGDSLLCNAAVNAAELNGSIALIYRGGCEFGAKALNAQNAGAVGVVIVNNEAGMMEMGPGVQGPNVTIPVMMVEQSTGAWLNAQINAGNGVARMGRFDGGELLICPGESVQLVGPGGWDNYVWNNGLNQAFITVSNAGNYNVSVTDANGCSTASANASVTVAPQATPGISQNGNTLITGVAAASYQWFFNGEPIPGATGNSIEIGASGVYTVQATNSVGCTATSADFNATLVNVIEQKSYTIGLYPNPANEVVTLTTDLAGVIDVRIYTADGRLVLQTGDATLDPSNMILNVSDLASGIYNVVIVGDDNFTRHTRLVISR